MNLRYLLIDDERNYDADRVARTFEEGLKALQEERWDVVMLDHDLGDPDPAKTGYGICNWLENNPERQPDMIQLVSSNPVGRDRMKLALEKMGYQFVVSLAGFKKLANGDY